MFRPWGFRFLATDRTTCNAASSSAAPLPDPLRPFIPHLTQPACWSLMWLREEAWGIRLMDIPLLPWAGRGSILRNFPRNKTAEHPSF